MTSSSVQPLQNGQPVPRLAEPFEPISSSTSSIPRLSASDGQEKKQSKRGIFGFGKKKKSGDTARQARPDPSAQTVSPTWDQASSTPATRRTVSNVTSGATCRGTGQVPLITTISPRLTSPVGSQIFERDVQESAGGPALMPSSPAVPSHISRENHIPPVLDASSEAITDEYLNPDTVEIITHASHQSAAAAVASPGAVSPGRLSLPCITQASGGYGTAFLDGGSGGVALSWTDELAAFTAEKGGRVPLGDSASNYGSFDTTDVRRLSFISFADVVQSEHAGHGGAGSVVGNNRDSLHMPPGLTSLSSMGMNRSSSPIRSPVSSADGDVYTSPLTSKSGSVKGLDMSPGRTSLGAQGPTLSGELTIETMSQALRRTGSGDLGGSVVTSLPISPV